MAKTTTVNLPAIDLRNMKIAIVGDTPLIVHRWSEKAKRIMLEKQTKIASRGRDVKDPTADFLSTIYRLSDGRHAIQAEGLKNSAVTACTSISSMTKVGARQAFFVEAERSYVSGSQDGSITHENLVPLLSTEQPTMREDLVRVGMGAADLRYRAQYFPWACEFTVKYNAHVLSAEQILNLFNTAGFAVGLYEWRPERNGDYGRFHVATDADQKFLKQAHVIFDNPKKLKVAS